MIRRKLLKAALLASGLGWGGSASAQLIVVTQSGSDVIATSNGSFNIAGATSIATITNANPSNLAGTLQVARVGTFSGVSDGYLLDTPFPIFGTLGSQFATSTSGVGFGTSSLISALGIYPAGTPLFLLPTGYVSGTALSATATWSNASIASLGLNPGVYTARFNGQDVTLRINAPVPEPSTWAMMLLGFGAIGATMRRRRRVLAFN